MRVTSNMYYKNIYGDNNALLSKNLFDVNKQIASGLKIQYAHEDIRAFTETMRLDNEITTLGQIKSSTQSAFKLSDQTDAVLGEFETSMNRMRTLLVNAANGTNSDVSLDAIAQELRGLEENFKNLANTSINGQYLFSGSAVDVKPIADDGTYMGNDAQLKAFTGSKTSQQYNISGEELFLGEKKLVRREVTTNVVQENLIAKYPALQQAGYTGVDSFVSSSSTIRELMGDSDNLVDVGVQKHFFYINGTTSDGTSLKQKIQMSDDDSIDALLNQIGNLYGNTPDLKVVNVNMNSNGQIIIEDKMQGSSKIDFHMVGATDLSGGAAANVTNIDNLGVGETNFDKIMLGTSTALNTNLHVKEFIKSSLAPADSVAATNLIEGTIYDKTEFSIDGAKLYSATPQILKGTNAFATPSTKLLDVASGTTLNGKSFTLEGTDVNGNPYSAQIDLATAGSTFTIGGNTYDIFNVGTPRAAVAADEMTYKQLMDVMNMVVTGNLPSAAPGSSAQYDSAVATADLRGKTFLSYDGKIQFEEMNTGNTMARMALYDSNSGDFTAPPSVMTFNTNNAITVRDPKTDFFKTLDEMITAVENYKLYPDSSSGNIRNVGIENAVAMMDDLQDHVFRAHSQVGAQTNSLNTSLQRTELLEISSMSLRSSVIDTDLAEASLTLAQLNTNYQAMLSTVGKISQLSLVNYL
ncbi:MAG: flagellar biosynthesis protein FlgL [Sulfurimonas sp. RIFCSPLOWO2_12_36_12]|uniref:flagellin N-terminal helical domain-containing protein n=1 Tax=Sulfurimonas sp. RIFCSPLOWO2_12_36_12 TaxID=1802253 RepID=UPI0008CC9B4A|nr:flagellar biosynthesis protein FlgL [Sulfurimonas sp. RIFCSPLOWO2_12_36_12]OHE02822.1 MAG: flagellar biosynthesis protein FlgL [Sulfurimonas sp. RIFCSPLOWO2_12_36_12]